MSGKSNAASRILRSPLRAIYVAVVGTLVAVTFIWMTSVGLLTPPRFSLVPINNKFSDSDNPLDDSGNQLQRTAVAGEKPTGGFGSTEQENADNVNNAEDAFISLTMARLESLVQKRLAAADLYKRRLNETVYQTEEYNRSYVSHIIIAGGLGNWMFMVGAMFGLSRTNNRIPVLLENYSPEKNFENFELEKRNRSVFLGNFTDEQSGMREKGAGKFTPDMAKMNSIKGNQNVLLIGYHQSWKYFHNYKDEIRSLFTFSQATFDAGLIAINNALNRFAANNASLAADGKRFRGTPALVGIHVRRGDIVHSPSQVAHGHKPASEEYLLRTALHFQRTHFPVLFVVISNDIPYCKKLYKEPNFLFLENNPEAVDIAVLSMMDYIILSVGTYGWWGAYLSDAREVYYFKDWPRNGSAMVNIYDHEDYFLPSWTSFV